MKSMKAWKNRKIKEDIIEYVINLLRLKKENEVIKYRTIKDIRKDFRLKQENEAMKDRIIKDIKNPFELEIREENYYKTIRFVHCYSNSCVKYKSIGDRKNNTN